MNAADLARLELAKRAYKAAQPNETEIQTGVRRARLSLGRPKSRRAWFSKGLVFIVLAIGSLAYAKPHALGELVEKVLPHGDANGVQRGVGAAALSLPLEAPTTADDKRARATQHASGTSDASQPPIAAAAPVATPAPVAAAASGATPKKTKQTLRSTAAQAVATPEPDTQDATAVSDWDASGKPWLAATRPKR